WARQDSNAFTLHKLTYRDCKTANPTLVSDLHVQARQKAAEAVRSAITLRKKGRKVGYPSSVSCPPRYNLHTYALDWEAKTVRLSTTGGRMAIPFCLPDCAAYATDC